MLILTRRADERNLLLEMTSHCVFLISKAIEFVSVWKRQKMLPFYEKRYSIAFQARRPMMPIIPISGIENDRRNASRVYRRVGV